MERLRTTIIKPDGPLDAQICGIGQSPGAEENLQGIPFVGPAGQFLNRCFAQVGVPRSSVLLYNVFVQRPPDNDAAYFFQDKKKTKLTWEGQEHVENLRRWLEALNPRPNVLVAFGYEAMFVLTGKHRIWKWRGSVLPCTLVPGYKVYVTLHPSGVLRLLNEPEYKLQGLKKEMANNALPLFLRDLERIVMQAQSPTIEYPTRKVEYTLSFQQILERLDWIDREVKDCAVDIETMYGRGGPVLWCIGFAPSPDHAFIIPFIQGGKLAWPLPQEAALLQAISRYFLNERAKKIFQNGAYDLSVLGRYYGLRVADGTYEDTMWCHHATYPQIKKSLETLASIYTWEPYYKDEGKVQMGRRVSDAAEFAYNGKDCCVTREIFPIVAQNAREMATWSGYQRSMSYMSSLLAMMLNGVKIDTEKKQKLGELFGAKAKFHHQQVCELEGESINLASSPQKIKLLYYKHGFKVQNNIRTKNPTADKDALQKLKRLYPNEPVIGHILNFQRFEKLANTYTSMEVEHDGRVRTSYGFISTWRLSSSESHFGGGGNLQNIPIRTDEGREIRRLFVPDQMACYDSEAWAGVVAHVTAYGGEAIAAKLVNGQKLLLKADKSQAEARVVAWEAGDLERIRQFLDPNTDVHWENAKIVFQLPHGLVYAKKDIAWNPITGSEHALYVYRQVGKTVVHAANYGMGPIMLMTILAREGFIIATRVAEQLLGSYLKRNPRLEEWHREVREKVRATRTLVSSYGRKRIFFGRFNDNLYRVAYAFSPQNTVGESLEDDIQQIWSNCPWVVPLLNVHDELVMEIEPHGFARTVRSICSIFERPLQVRNRELIIPVDISAGPSWGDTIELSKEKKSLCRTFS